MDRIEFENQKLREQLAEAKNLNVTLQRVFNKYVIHLVKYVMAIRPKKDNGKLEEIQSLARNIMGLDLLTLAEWDKGTNTRFAPATEMHDDQISASDIVIEQEAEEETVEPTETTPEEEPSE